jgi:NADPH-dependent 2,4-dienoyl-CoA reductase/sulfur reductase-like enzyme
MVPAAAAMSLTPRGFAADTHHVVVVGGGFAGSTVAKYLKMWGNGGIEVTLIEPWVKHVSCIMSNLVLNGQLKISDLSFDYNTLRDKYGVNVVYDRAQHINGPGKELKLEDAGSWMSYDSLVIATGIKFDAIPGLDSTKIPHAWIAGEQTDLLRNQIRDMPDNGTFVMTIPEKPYRCPPGPYERACLVADILKRGGGSPKVIVLDANDGIQAERETFERAFTELYGDIIDYRPLVKVDAVDSNDRIVYPSKVVAEGEPEIELAPVHGDVVNVIPRHGAPQLLVESGLTEGKRWAPVAAMTYESTLEDFPDVYVIGDAQGTGQPKSGHMANSQAKVCADAIVRRAAELPVDGDTRLDNITTNSACFSPITADEASWLTAVFKYNRDNGKMGLVPGSLGESHNWNSENYKDMFAWSENLFADTFK